MENQSNWIKLVEEEEPPATDFLQDFWRSLEPTLPDSLKFLEGASVKSLSSNKSYLLALMTTPKGENIVAKLDLESYEMEFSGEPFSLTKRESIVLNSIENLEIAPKVIHFYDKDTEDAQTPEEERFPSALFTTLEGLGNNLSDQPVQEWWESYKEDLIKVLAKLHNEDSKGGLNESFHFKEWLNSFVFNEDNIAEFILEPHTNENLFELMDILQSACNKILENLDENKFVLCHNNLSKSSVLHNPSTDSKFKLINFHKAIVGPPELDAHSIYHRLGLEEYDIRSGGIKNPIQEIKNLYLRHTGRALDFSPDFKFINTVQRIMMLLFENNMPPMILYQSNLNMKYAKRRAEFEFLKRRLFSIIIDDSFSCKSDFSRYTSQNMLPFSELILYG